MKPPPVQHSNPKSNKTLKRKRQSSNSHDLSPNILSKGVADNLVYSTRDIPWEEQVTLGQRFRESGQNAWPVRCILQERGTGKSKRYLVDWLQHPLTGERFEPTWCPASDLGDDLLNEWNKRQSQSSTLDTTSLSNGLHDSQNIDDSAHSTIKSSKSGTLAPSSIEIAETPQDISQRTLPTPQNTISVSIPTPSINKSDYESLPSSQIAADLGLRDPDPPPDATPGPHIRRRRAPVLSDSSSLAIPSRLPNNINHLSQGSLNQVHASRRPTHQKSISSPSAHSSSRAPAPRAIFEDRDSESSSETGSFATPEYVPSTQGGRQASVELGSDPIVLHFSTPLLSPDLAEQSDKLHDIRTSTQSTTVSPLYTTGAPPSPSDRFLATQPSAPSPSWHFQTQLPLSSISSIPQQSHSRDQRLFEAGRTFIQIMDNQSSQATDSIDSSAAGTVHPNESTPQSKPSSDSMPADTSPVIRTVNPNAVFKNGYSSSIDDNSATEPALPIQDSIEDEHLNEEAESSDSKQSSSQQSVENEQDVDHVDGLILPTVPIVGPAQYCLALPAEGKVQSTYFDIMKAKRKVISKFINRHEAIGSGNGSPNRTHQRNDIVELVQRLHDTTTHIDLGLPGFSTQYSLDSQEHAAYANYAGSKFSFLGHLVDVLKPVECTIVVMAQSGPIQDLLEQYLTMKHVSIKRHHPLSPSESPGSERSTSEFEVELVSTVTSYDVTLRRKPPLIIAFDASFDAQDPRVRRMRTVYSNRNNQLIPVLHLLVANSSEHVDLCIPKSMPSPLRLKLLLRATWQARPNLGGKVTYIPNASDGPDGRPIDMADFQRAVRKSPERKLVMLANLIARAAVSLDFDSHWPFTTMPKLELSEAEEIPIISSGFTSVAETPREPLVSQAEMPLSRADTPSGKKRLLDVDVPQLLSKRQRLTPTPLRETVEGAATPLSQAESLRDIVSRLQADLLLEKTARKKAEEERDEVKGLLDQWKRDHANLQRRYEKRVKQSHELTDNNKKLMQTIENNKSRQTKAAEDITTFKEKVKGLQEELTKARDEIKAGGGDGALLEVAREEARTLLAKKIHLEKSLENTRKDFEFTRQQYQNASNKAVELSNQVRDLEEQASKLSQEASTEKRRLKETNFQETIKRHTAKVQALELENRARDSILKKLEEENRQLKKSRGVQTRGSSVQPPGSPSMDVPGRGTRSRQGSPAPGLLGQHHGTGTNRGSLLRHER
ncbi:hypothetical protein PV10_04084 [Exophiala mesophila]|uniref:Chromo domain-containing protein n=1 Tax=Exophiala mesophila TaxID=212818 RepID=A0A0D2A174_EXOME|nr:uncharacterized protein PV10_04084 [Exophiala mesophila]KIV92818.1 hypothetical protein PV10_04084 [Exophiala mesophila]